MPLPVYLEGIHNCIHTDNIVAIMVITVPVCSKPSRVCPCSNHHFTVRYLLIFNYFYLILIKRFSPFVRTELILHVWLLPVCLLPCWWSLFALFMNVSTTDHLWWLDPKFRYWAVAWLKFGIPRPTAFPTLPQVELCAFEQAFGKGTVYYYYYYYY